MRILSKGLRKGKHVGKDVIVMNRADEQKLMKMAIAHYGHINQTMKAVEELGELTQALARQLISLGRYVDKGLQERLADHVAEEMADVEIMIDQLKIIEGNAGSVANWRAVKLARLGERIKEKGSGSRK